MPWPSRGLRRASVNSFGFGGSNSHVILDDVYNYLRLRGLTAKHCTTEEPPSIEEISVLSTSSTERILLDDAHHISANSHAAKDYPQYINGHNPLGFVSNAPPKLLVWSSADEGGLSRMADLYSKHLMSTTLSDCDVNKKTTYIDHLAYTLSSRRSSLPWKSFASAHSTSELHNHGVSLSRPVRSSKSLGIAYVFTGQGAQFSGMGKELLIFDVFRDTLQKIEICLRTLGCEWSLQGKL